ncbi:hypothetical protein NPIL_286431 [Nephila pilipes]|uniref:Uncharacterized protein n=1 Tax=Nephila pilipes TaxID=299642 RepID=A0A8X6N8T9_NEPPI|nr:hypothetical protein NPIL_286431 [Nephila pilipes]
MGNKTSKSSEEPGRATASPGTTPGRRHCLFPLACHPSLIGGSLSVGIRESTTQKECLSLFLMSTPIIPLKCMSLSNFLTCAAWPPRSRIIAILKE